MLGSIPDMLSSAKLLPVVCQYSSYHFRMSQVVKEAILSVDGTTLINERRLGKHHRV